MRRHNGQWRSRKLASATGRERHPVAVGKPDLRGNKSWCTAESHELGECFDLLPNLAGQLLFVVLASTLGQWVGIRFLVRRQQQPEHNDYDTTARAHGIRHRLVVLNAIGQAADANHRVGDSSIECMVTGRRLPCSNGERGVSSSCIP
jgi:hypothetical protein